MLRESQNFFFNLMARPETIGQLKKDRAKTLKRFFRSEEDRAALMSVPLERLETYRKHISIGLLGGIESAFPLLRSLVSQEEWNDLLNDFYLKRLTRSPIARHVFREFSNYLSKKYRGPLLKRMPYLKELAEYENLDLRLLYEEDHPEPPHLATNKNKPSTTVERLAAVPIMNPHVALRVYRWPVHRIGRGFSSPKRVKPGRFVLLVYRDPESLSVRFLEANTLVADLVKTMTRGRKSAGAILETLLRRHRPQDAPTFIREGIAAIDTLMIKGVVLGFRGRKGET